MNNKLFLIILMISCMLYFFKCSSENNESPDKKTLFYYDQIINIMKTNKDNPKQAAKELKDWLLKNKDDIHKNNVELEKQRGKFPIEEQQKFLSTLLSKMKENMTLITTLEQDKEFSKTMKEVSTIFQLQ